MSKRSMSVVLILLSSGISILTGILLDRASPGTTENYRAVYYGARCLLNHADPYKPADFLRVYMSESGELPVAPTKKQLFLRATVVCVNLPTALFLVVPLAMLPWSLSQFLWLSLIACSLTVAALLTYDLAREYAWGPALVLICIMMANSEVLFVTGNTAGIAVGLCVIAVWCFVRRRFEWLGVVLMAVSLAMKPHDSGLVWLYLLLAGGVLRKRSLQVLALTGVITLPAVLWVSMTAPDWSRELRANLAATSAQGDISDPGPTSISRQGSADVIIDLQTVVSVFDDDPRVYNPVVYAVCGLLLLVWGFTVLRAQPVQANVWLALASISALTMLGSYHRPYDARLLLLGVPGSAYLWNQRGPIVKIYRLLACAAILLTADIPLAILSLLTGKLSVPAMGLIEKVCTIPITRPAPIALLLLAIFSLSAYVISSQAHFKTELRNEPVWTRE